MSLHQKFCLSLYYNSDISYLFINGKKDYKFKASNKNVNLPQQFGLGSISNKFDHVDSEEVSLKGNVYNFLVYYNATDKSSILNIHKYLQRKIIKNMFGNVCYY